MYSIEDLEKIKKQNISEKESRFIFCELIKNNQSEEIKYFISIPGIKEKINLNNNSFFMQICLYKNCEAIEYILFSKEFKPENESLNQEDKDFAFSSFCKCGEIQKAKRVYENFGVSQSGLNKALQLSCIFGQLESVKFLLNGKTIKEKADIHYESETALNNACREGHLEIVKYLLESPELLEHANIHLELNDVKDYPFVLASEYNRNDIVKYLMKVKGKNKPDIKSTDYIVVKQYLLSGNLEMLRHIIEEENIDIHLDNDYLFIYGADKKSYHILEYLIMEKNIEINKNIEKYLKEKPDQIIEQMLEKRQLHQKMKSKLQNEVGQRKELMIKKI